MLSGEQKSSSEAMAKHKVTAVFQESANEVCESCLTFVIGYTITHAEPSRPRHNIHGKLLQNPCISPQSPF